MQAEGKGHLRRSKLLSVFFSDLTNNTSYKTIYHRGRANNQREKAKLLDFVRRRNFFQVDTFFDPGYLGHSINH